ncbi:MazG-like family protein [Clostridium mediterraneense]|uniref:MazG-like family protein n=1 Tax=Clostridium mediterraneense TaxID=1805472 RepID=UPI0008367B3A|nr:MazG-like family protein [Clostridium mediterraneense]
MKKDNFNIMGNIKAIEELKAQLICITGELFTLLTKGAGATKNVIIDCIGSLVIVLYVLAEKLGYSAMEVDDSVKKSLKMAIIEDDVLEREGKSLSKLLRHFKNKL